MTRPALAYLVATFGVAAAVPVQRAVVALHQAAPGAWLLLLVAAVLAVTVGLARPQGVSR